MLLKQSTDILKIIIQYLDDTSFINIIKTCKMLNKMKLIKQLEKIYKLSKILNVINIYHFTKIIYDLEIFDTTIIPKTIKSIHINYDNNNYKNIIITLSNCEIIIDAEKEKC